MIDTEPLYRETLDDKQRMVFPYEIFGLQFMRIESVIFDFAARLSPDYTGGCWTFFLLEPGRGFLMTVSGDELYSVNTPNGYHGVMSGDALGTCACLFCYSHLSFDGQSALAQECARQFHTLRAWSMEHPEARAILAAID